MIEQKVRRRRDFQHGKWVRMGDGQRWMFPRPPAPGTDREYDALIRCLLEAEDADEARRFELALGILLLSRNYDPQPGEYEAIFSFGEDRATRLAAQAAISELIYNDLEERCVECVPAIPCVDQTVRIRFPFRAFRTRALQTINPTDSIDLAGSRLLEWGNRRDE